MIRATHNKHGYQWTQRSPGQYSVCGQTRSQLPAGAYLCEVDYHCEPKFKKRDLQVDELIVKRGGPLLESAAIFDEFHRRGVAGRSVAWRLVFRDPTRTLRDKEVEAAVTRILDGLEKQLGVERREA